MGNWRNLSDIRREYGLLSLDEHEAGKNPIALFKRWFEDALAIERSDPTAMVLSTVDAKGYPDSRVVLLKGVEEDAFVFFTNYQSTKAMQIQDNPYVALNFYWAEKARQIRVRGRVKRTTAARSDAYFASRPQRSQLGALASPQSREIVDRTVLEHALNDLIAQYGQEPVVRPSHWGGYMVLPDEMEFWQGRDNRLHDRLFYFRERGEWNVRRLAP